MNFKSGAQIANILKITKDVANIFNIKDLQTLSANGKLDADYNIKSDLKTVNSRGYLKIPTANLYYGLYKIGVDSINADIRLDNNNINIKNIGFSILNQPLKFYGTISEDAVSDLHLTANKLSLKGLIVALGQASLLKDNNVNSGTISMNVDIKGKLDKINPLVKINLENLNIKTYFATMGASNCINVEGHLPNDKAKMTKWLDEVIASVDEKELRRYRDNLRHL